MFKDRPEKRGLERNGTDVIVLSRFGAVIDALASDPRATPLGPAKVKPWTDDFSDVLGALLAGREM